MNLTENARHTKPIFLVDNILECYKTYREARMERDKEIYEQQMKIIDGQIGGMVYDLYGLTEGEI